MTRRSSPNSESPSKRFQAFEFGADDKRIEKHSAKMIAKFRNLAKRTSTKKAKSKDLDSPITKYKFLQFFTKNLDKEEFGNQPIDVDGRETTKTPQEKVSTSLSDDDANDVAVSNQKYGGARDMSGVVVYDLSSSSNQKNKKVCSLTDDDDKLEPSTLVFTPSKNGAPLEEQATGTYARGYESVEAAITNLHLESKESGGVGDTNNTSGIQIYPHYGRGHEVIESLDFKFDGEIIYPKGDPDAVSISKKDLELLHPETFINDTIVDFYIQYLKGKIQPEEKNRFHFFNSFFFRKLSDIDKDHISSSEAKAAFQRLYKWTRKVSIFEKDYIFIPVNKSLHWSLIIICHPGEVANVEDDEVESLPKVPCILHMDSIKGSHRGLKNLIQRYLCEEWKERHGETEDGSLKFLNLRFIALQLPQQGNSFDCGLFLLHYVERFLEEAPVNFSLTNIAKSSKFLKKNWFPPVDASLKRSHIKKLLCTILEDHSREALVADSVNEHIPSQGPNNTDRQQNDIHFLEEVSSSSSSNASGSGISLGASPPIQLPAHNLGLMSPIEEIEDSEDQVSEVADVEGCQKGTGSDSGKHIKDNVDETQTPTSSSGSENLSALRIDQEHSLLETKAFNCPRKTDASESSSSEEIACFVVPDSEEENDDAMPEDIEVKYFSSSLEDKTDSVQNINPKEMNVPLRNEDPVSDQQSPKRPRLSFQSSARRLRQTLLSTWHL